MAADMTPKALVFDAYGTLFDVGTLDTVPPYLRKAIYASLAAGFLLRRGRFHPGRKPKASAFLSTG
jgi:FMN phosphatase YigB (HAD superfamily)